VARWFYPDPYQYWAYAPRFWQAFAGRAFEHGTAFGTAGCAASALWLPPGLTSDEEAMSSIVDESISPADLERQGAFLERQAAIHPREPHWYLPLIGVDPMYQGHGYGSALLAFSLVIVDRDGGSAYLEATNPRNRALYERFGFETVGVIQVADSPPMWPMFRRPRS